MNNLPTDTDSNNAYRKATMLHEILAREINNLVQELETKRKDISEVKAFIESWKKFSNIEIDKDLGILQIQPSVDNFLAQTPLPLRAASQPRIKNSKKEEVANATRSLIEQHGHPLTREELYPMLIEQGLVIDGSDRLMVLSTMLWRMMKDEIGIVRLKGGGYWLSDRPWPETGYVPIPVADITKGTGKFMDVHDVIGDHVNSPVDHTPPETFWDNNFDNEDS